MAIVIKTHLTKLDKILLFAGINAATIVFLTGVFLFDIFGKMWEIQFHFYMVIGILIYIAIIPFIGRSTIKSGKMPRVFLYILFLKIGIVTFLEALDFFLNTGSEPFFFPGYGDFKFIKVYCEHFLNGNLPVEEWYTLKNIYYPPGTGFLLVFLTFINPTQSTLLYRYYMVIFEVATFYLVFKISSLPKLKIPKKYRVNGVIYGFIALSTNAVVDWFGKYDAVIVFLTVLGIYLYLKEKLFTSTLILVFCALIKLYPAIWLFGLFLYHLKKKKYNKAFKLLFYSILFGSIILGLTFLIEGFVFFEYLINTLNLNIFQTYPIYSQNIWFFLRYLNIPFVNLIPYALLLISYLLFIIKYEGDINHRFFLKSLVITFLFFTWINTQYMHWVIPFICVDLLKSRKKTQWLAIFEYSSLVPELAFNFFIVSTYGVMTPLYIDPTTPPPLSFLIVRLLSLGLLFMAFFILLFPRRFNRFFKEDDEILASIA